MPTDSPTPIPALAKRWYIAAPTFIAILSLGSSIFQSWNYSRNIESAQRNVLRAESLRTCREIIEVFFSFRLKAEEANRAAAASGSMAGPELKALVYKFGAFGTFLANFQDGRARALYSELSWDLLTLADDATKLSAADFGKRFAPIDEKFGRLNEDCVKAAQSTLI